MNQPKTFFLCVCLYRLGTTDRCNCPIRNNFKKRLSLNVRFQSFPFQYITAVNSFIGDITKMVASELTWAKRTLVRVLHCECVYEDRPC